jgi:cadmium resistance protein CadD (predicted permease)
MEFFSFLLIAVAAFAASNIGDIFILLAFFLDKKFTTREIILGQYIGICALIVLCLILGAGLSQLPHEYLHWLGFLPIGVGLWMFYKLRFESREIEKLRQEPKRAARLGINAISVATIFFADASDNLAVMPPLFARSSPLQIVLLLIIFVLLIGVWSYAAHSLVHHRRLGVVIEKYGAAVAPLVLMVLGVVIFFGQ